MPLYPGTLRQYTNTVLLYSGYYYYYITSFALLSYFHTDVGQGNQSAPANAIEDAAAVSAISKQQILVQYLKVNYSVLSSCITSCASDVLPAVVFLRQGNPGSEGFLNKN